MQPGCKVYFEYNNDLWYVHRPAKGRITMLKITLCIVFISQLQNYNYFH